MVSSTCMRRRFCCRTLTAQLAAQLAATPDPEQGGFLPELLVVRTSVGKGRIVGIDHIVKRVYSYYFGTVSWTSFRIRRQKDVVLHLLEWILNGCTALCCRRSLHVSTERCINEPPYVTTCSLVTQYASCRELAVLFFHAWLAHASRSAGFSTDVVGFFL